MNAPAAPHGWLTAERLRLYPAALLVSLFVAVVLSILTADGSATATGRLGGDFPAFYGAGTIVWEGNVGALYDWQAQRDAQVGLHPPGEEGRFLAFAYPPFFAACYAPLAALDYISAYAVHTAVMCLLILLGVVALRGVLPRVDRYPLAAYAGCLAVIPLFRAATGGQNTAVTFLLIALTWRLWHDRRDALAGIPLGLLLFKPQLGIPLAALVIVQRRWAVLPTFLATAVGLYLAGAVLGGWGWPAWWWGQIAGFHAMDQDINAPNSVGLLGFLEALLGVGHPVALVLGWGGALTLALGAAWAWFRDLGPPILRWGATAIVIVLVPPHAMFYDSGLVALAWLAWAQHTGRAGLTTLFALYAAHLLSPLSASFGANPMLPILLTTLALLLHRARA